MGVAALAISTLALAGCGSTGTAEQDDPAAQKPPAAATTPSDAGGKDAEGSGKAMGDGADKDKGADGGQGGDQDKGQGSGKEKAEGADFVAPGTPVNAEDYRFTSEFRGEKRVQYSFSVDGGDLRCTIRDTEQMEMPPLAGCHGTLPSGVQAVPGDGGTEKVQADTVVMESGTGKEAFPEASTEAWLLPVTENGGDFIEDLKPLKAGESIVVGDLSCGALGKGAVTCFTKDQSFTLSAKEFTTKKNPNS